MTDPRTLPPADGDLAQGDCGCCAGLRDETPMAIDNRPGLAAIAYRSGTFGTFKRSMLAGLTTIQRPRLADLATRDDDDFSIALIDAWAVAGDVLTFYAERIANEHYLRTATEERSVSEQAALIGYRLASGVAAATQLAFTLETAPGAPLRAPIAAGTRVQSIPGPGELPQTFETTEPVDGQAAWNAPLPLVTAPRTPRNGDTAVLLAGTPNLARGDLLLLVAAEREDEPLSARWALRRVTTVQRVDTPLRRVPTLGGVSDAPRTLASWVEPLTELEDVPAQAVSIFVLRRRASLFGFNAPDPRLFTAEIQFGLGDALLRADIGSDLLGPVIDWAFESIADHTLHLDAIYDGLAPGGWAVVGPPAEDPVLSRIAEVAEVSRAAYALSAKVSTLVVDTGDDVLAPFGGLALRATTLALGSEPLPLAEAPIDEPLAGAEISVDGALAALEAPRTLLVRGRRQRVIAADTGITLTLPDGSEGFIPLGATATILSRRIDLPGLVGQVLWQLLTDDGVAGEVTTPVGGLTYAAARDDDPRVSETAIVTAVAPDPLDPTVTLLTLEEGLVNVYDRATTELFGNVAAATHGETVNEVLGNGDAARAYQSFTLRRGPLTWLSSSTPSGAESTLRVWVNDVVWREVPSFFASGPRDRVYITRTDERRRTVVQFGDGINGARPPTGVENVRACYRVGIGEPGEVASEQLSLLMKRPLGVKSVLNPAAADGAQDPQTRDDARENAPLTVRTLDRIVSLRDYEDFARAYAGIGKASAVWVWVGDRRGPHITVAGADGDPVEPGDTLYANLVAAIGQAGSTRVPFVVKSYRPAFFTLAAGITVQPDHLPDPVLAATRAALSARFAFATRAFGQLVALSEVIEVLQNVPGVLAVDVDRLHRVGADALLHPLLTADAPAPGDTASALGAELLLLDPAALAGVEVRG